ncbi:MAG: type II toxin-antitoxin system Phd/YefM family antitoxin [Myxococcota bacterium]
MKVLAMRDAKSGLSATLDRAQRERIVITRKGKPSAILIGVEGQDFEEVMLASNPKFWALIEASRRDPRTFSAREVRAHFAKRDKRRAPAPSKR